MNAKKIKEPKKLLLIRTDRIGDVVLTTPVIKALRMTYPKCHITMLVAKSARTLVTLNPFLDEVKIDDRQFLHNGFLGFFKLVQSIRQEKYDTVVVLHTKKRTNLVAFLAGIPQRLGFKNKKFGFLLTHPVKDARHTGEKHETEYCMDLIERLNVERVEPELLVSVHKTAESWIEQLLHLNQIHASEKLIAVHLGASDPAKRWPLEKFKELIDLIRENVECRVILVGSPDTLTLSNSLNLRFNNSLMNMAGKTSLAQLISLLKHSHLLISNDSGPVHIAAALGTPVVSIFTRNQPGINPERWRPLGEKSRFVSVPPDESVSFKKAGALKEGQYLERIGVEEVYQAAAGLF